MNQKRWIEIGMTALLLCGIYWLSGEGARLTSKPVQESGSVVAVDPGHGGHRLRRTAAGTERLPVKKKPEASWKIERVYLSGPSAGEMAKKILKIRRRKRRRP